MIKTMVIFLFFILFSLSNNVFAVTKDYEKIFKSSLTSKKLNLNKFGISMYKKEPSSGLWKPVFVHNENKRFIPASISKILTSVGLFELFGGQKKIETRVFSAKKPKEKILKGNLYIQGGGDPTLVSEKMWLLVNEIKKWGVEKIEGDLVFDDSVFDKEPLAGGRTNWGQRAYNAALSGLALNWNSIRVRFLDRSTLNVVTDPRNSYFDLKRRKSFKKKSQVKIRKLKDKEALSVFYGKDALDKEISIYRRVFKPRKYFESQFQEFLKSAGITFSGAVLWLKVPEGFFEVGKIESDSMSGMVALMMKHSNNFIADMLTKVCHGEVLKSSGSYKGGLSVLKANFKKVSSFSNGLVYKSASGLSRKNQVSPGDFTKFILATQDQGYFPELLSSFPISCVDGTLKDRLCKIPGLVRAKTGLLAGVSALSGFYKKESKEYAFTFIYNGSNSEQFHARQTFDNFLEKL